MHHSWDHSCLTLLWGMNLKMWGNLRLNQPSDFIQANQFHGYVHRSPYDHISTFNDIFNTVKISHVSDNALTLCLLSFSSTGDALSWLRSFPPISLSLWEDVVAKLLKNYFPKSKTLKGKVDISLFQQMHDEALSEACERYQSLLWQTPTIMHTTYSNIENFLI